MHLPHGVRYEGGVALVGDEAVRWLRHRGFDVRMSGPEMRVFSDVLEVEDIEIGRLYHNAADVVRRADADDGVALTIALDGELTVETGSLRTALSKGQVLAMSRRTSIRFEGALPYGVVGVRLLGASASAVFDDSLTPVVLEADSAPVRMLLAVTNVLLNIAPSVPKDGWSPMSRTLRAACDGVLDQLAAVVRRPRSSAVLLDRAHRVIAANSSDYNFTVSDLAETLSVSPALLHRAFASVGTTPLTELRRRRVEEVQRLLNGFASSAIDRERLVRQAGFTSLKAYRSALRALERNSGGE